MCLEEWDTALWSPSAGLAAGCTPCRSRSRARGRACDGVGRHLLFWGARCPPATGREQWPGWETLPACGGCPSSQAPLGHCSHPSSTHWRMRDGGTPTWPTRTDPEVLLCKGAGCPCSACLHLQPPRCRAGRWHRRETPQRCANTALEKPSSRPPYL